MKPSISRQFAQFGSMPCVFPDSVLRAANRAMFDTIGAMIAGGRHETVKAVAQAFVNGSGTSTLATGGRSDVETCALVNGTAAHVWDIDDTSYTGIMHGSACVLPVVLALAEAENASASQVRRAFIVGSEVAYALADLCTHDHYYAGWWSTATFGLIGATAAAGVMLDLTEDQLAAALGLAASAAGGGKVVFGTAGKPFLVGEAARRAITFAKAGSAGLSGPETAFEDSRGFLALLNKGTQNGSALDDIGTRWRLVDPGLMFKSSPVCSAAHAAMEQVVALMKDLDCVADEISDIHVEIPELVDISLVYPQPKTQQEAQFSLPFCVACAARNGRVRFEDLSQQAFHDQTLGTLMRKVRKEVAPDLSTEDMRRQHPECARVTLTVRDGRVGSGFCGDARGMPGNPMSDDQLVQKFEAAVTYAGFRPLEHLTPGSNPVELMARIMSQNPEVQHRRIQ